MKVFSIKRFIEESRHNKCSEVDIYANMTWARGCNGLTQEECLSRKVRVHDSWMIEREENNGN